ncbi:hypothetical protein V6N12_049237 [Hibiscus sabdariffa]|uniref:Uncharacterized protein n=1 Tax=Hibiscus sabdariffa TaxID=183260 RepID=A0ABR2EK06_9ROSI
MHLLKWRLFMNSHLDERSRWLNDNSVGTSYRLRQGICDVVVNVYFTYLHISSVYDLPDEMEAPKNVFGSLMRSGFLCLRNGSIVVTTEIHSIRYAWNNP